MKKSAWMMRLMDLYARRRMRGVFRDVLVRGLDDLKTTLAQEPVILASNHVSWWDPLAIIVLNQAMCADGYGLMAETSLAELPWFGGLGALPLCRTSPSRALKQLDAAAAMLDRKGRFVAMFPSGRQIPAHLPLEFQSGILRLESRSGARIVPVALRYEFGEGPRPTLWMSIGSPLERQSDSWRVRGPALEGAVKNELHHIDQQLLRWSRDPMGPVDAAFTSLLYRRPRGAQAERVPLLARTLGGGTDAPAGRRNEL
jgi:1-acyl-sn-glycerol-3-phosphate acyltransferase